MNDRTPRFLALGLAAFAACALVSAAHATELFASARANGFVLHDANETLQQYCHWNAGTLTFTLPDGTSWELVTSTSDPAIANPGDGQFHPFEAAEVKAALAGVHFPLQHVGAEIFILPYPRRDGLESAAGPGLILLSPGVRPLPAALQHSEFTHELGHVVQYALMPDEDAASWARYRGLRGITDANVFNATAAHADRPHEIFAEDFRVLCGDAQANYSGSIENAAIAYPAQVSGLPTFVQDLAGGPAITSPVAVVSAVRGAIVFARTGTHAAALDLFDVTGRRVATVSPTVEATGCRWTWDGRDAAGASVQTSVLFARVRDGLGGVAKLTHLP